jgi:putative phosphoesterase
MKLGLISDVHGDIESLQRAWEFLQAIKVDRVVCAGDVVGYGPHPDEVVAFLQDHEIATVRGNHDRWALMRRPGTPDEFGGAGVSPATLDFLRTLQPHLLLADGPHIAVIVHGSPRSDMEFVEPHTHPGSKLRADLQKLDANLLVVGHTHTPMCYRCEQGLVVNPGSLVGRVFVLNSSRTFAVVDFERLTAAFYYAYTGEPIEVGPWPADAEASGREPDY